MAEVKETPKKQRPKVAKKSQPAVILENALKLSLSDRINLMAEIRESIKDEKAKIEGLLKMADTVL